MKVKFKRLGDLAQLPKYASEGDAGMDMVAIGKEVTEDYIEYDTGVAVEIPEGHVGLLFPRSSISKKQLTLANSVGVVDSGYRGSIKFRFNYNPKRELAKEYHISDKVGQLIILPYPHIEPEWADELSDTERGDKGFGSTS